ncbi:portal protein [bacterium]|nr:portal protein [bacterium]
MYGAGQGDGQPEVGGNGASNKEELKRIMTRYKKAKGRWNSWTDLWEEIYDYVIPHRESFFQESQAQRRTENIYDETAVVGLPKFASRLQLGFFPPNGRAFRLAAGPDFPKELMTKDLQKELDKITDMIHEGLRNSNFNSELHEGLQDLGIGTMNMLVEEGRFQGDLHFTAVPPTNLALTAGRMDGVSDWFRWNNNMDITEVKHRYPKAKYTDKMLQEQKKNPTRKMKIVEATLYDENNRFKDEYTYYLISETDNEILLKETMNGRGSIPWITTRWSKSGFEVWGRGPVLQAMPAIKTVNLTVQLILENAEMAIAGSYVYDDDGVFNPDNITIQPGTFIPRSPGSTIDTLQNAGRFDVGQLVLDDMRRNIAKALFIDELDSRPNARTPLSATEVSERLADVARDMGAVAGRMQKEFLQPLVERIIYIYTKQGLLDIPKVDGRELRIVPVSPLLRAQDQQDVSDFVRFQQTVASTFGPEITPALYHQEKVVEFLARKFGIQEELLADQQQVQNNVQMIQQMMQGQQQGQ